MSLTLSTKSNQRSGSTEHSPQPEAIRKVQARLCMNSRSFRGCLTTRCLLVRPVFSNGRSEELPQHNQHQLPLRSCEWVHVSRLVVLFASFANVEHVVATG